MAIISTVLLVFFVIVAILLILLVLIQNEEGDSLGGIFAGGSGSAFGSRSGNVLTRITTVLGALFLIFSLGLALFNKSPAGTGVTDAAREIYGDAVVTDWVDRELDPHADHDHDLIDNAIEQEAISEDELSANSGLDSTFGD